MHKPATHIPQSEPTTHHTPIMSSASNRTYTPNAPIFTLPIRIYYEDTDAGGIVYNANYLKFAERARTEMLRSAGINQHEIRESLNLIFVMTEVRIRYKRPARLDETLYVNTRLLHHSKSRLTLEQNIDKNGRTITQIEVELACVKLQENGQDFKPHPIPNLVLDAMQQSGE